MINLELQIEEEKVRGLYDSGANITMISFEFFKKTRNKMFTNRNLRFKTMSGEDKIMGLIFLQMKIFAIEKKMRVFVVDRKDFKYDVLIGLNSILEFRLAQDHLGKISQVPHSIMEGERKK